MTDRAQRRADVHVLDVPTAPSSLMSSRWSRDNLVTSHPSQLYGGAVELQIDEPTLEVVVQEIAGRVGPIQLGTGRMGVLTWDIACASAGGRFVLQVPRALDGPGSRGRARRDVPRRNVENLRDVVARGLGRFVMAPRDLVSLDGGIEVALLAALPDHHPLGFGRGAVQVELEQGQRSWRIGLGPRATADLLAEMIAALAYHYDADLDGGTAVADVFVNDGDFAARRRSDGSFDVRLTALRARERHIGPSLLLLYLTQLMTYEDWDVGGRLTGLPTPMSNPSLAFEGVWRGRRYRHRDLGGADADGGREATAWIRDFGRSREGRGYQPWVARWLDGALPPSFGGDGGDPRERWWRLTPLQERLGVLELAARRDPESGAAAAARDLRAFVDRLSRELGRAPPGPADRLPINDAGRDDLLRLLAEAEVPEAGRAAAVEDLFAGWPYRSLDQLLARVPAARSLRQLERRLHFGPAIPDAEQGTLASLDPLPGEGSGRRAPLANPELLSRVSLPPSLHADAARTFPTFEAYMDASLHDPAWGYYARHVAIGRGGHFITNPESLSPRYGRWIARLGLRLWREMVARGELAASDVFHVVELGAGNGRLARDIVDGAALLDGGGEFASRLRYHIYETSAALRDKQHALLGRDAVVADGDARRPGATLRRDFPEGIKGLVITNELPDAFGVHKVVLSPGGDAFAALVIPRVEPALRAAVGEPLARRITETDTVTRRSFGLRGNRGDLYLDAPTWMAVMASLAALPDPKRERLLTAALWFEEAYVPVSAVPELAAHLAANTAATGSAMAGEDSAVVQYVNVHASRFIREIGSLLANGLVVTIDYGDSTAGLVAGARRGELPFRVYGDQRDFTPRPNDPYAAPGFQDMTTDVNFTDLARAGETAGLCLVHYGPERDIVGDELAELSRAAEADDAIAEFVGNPVFKVLVLGTRASDAVTSPLMTRLPLTK